MSQVVIGVKRNRYKYWIYTLFYKQSSSSFDRVFVSEHFCSGVDVLKGVVESYNPRYTVYCIVNNNGDVYYYHPRYRRWYKNLSQDSLRNYFFWLIPERVNNNLSPNVAHR